MTVREMVAPWLDVTLVSHYDAENHLVDFEFLPSGVPVVVQPGTARITIQSIETEDT